MGHDPIPYFKAFHKSCRRSPWTKGRQSEQCNVKEAFLDGCPSRIDLRLLILWYALYKLVIPRWSLEKGPPKAGKEQVRKFSLTLAKVLVIPICLPVGVTWNSLSNMGMKQNPQGNHIRPFCNINPCTITQSGCLSELFVIASCRAINSGLTNNSYFNSLKIVKLGNDNIRNFSMEGFNIWDKASASEFNLLDLNWMV